MSKKMIKIYSKIQKKKLLHQIFDKNNLSKKRTNLCNDKEFLQAAFLNLKKRDKIRPHSHIWKKPRFKNNERLINGEKVYSNIINNINVIQMKKSNDIK